MLAAIIERSYVLFSKYNAIRPLDICTDCCMTPEAENTLASLPVRQIPRDLLAEYNDGAKPEKTRIEEVKHFLPRYFDLVAQFQFPTHSVELSFSRLTPFNKSEWTEQELDLLKQFSKEFFKHCLYIYPLPSFHDSIDAILIMFWRAAFNVDDLLAIWEVVETKESVLHFRDLYFHGFNQCKPTKLFSGFGDKQLADIIRCWVDSDRVKHRFAQAIEKLIIESSDVEGADINEINLLYDVLTTKSR
jgi:hypothetical protein